MWFTQYLTTQCSIKVFFRQNPVPFSAKPSLVQEPQVSECLPSNVMNTQEAESYRERPPVMALGPEH